MHICKQSLTNYAIIINSAGKVRNVGPNIMMKCQLGFPVIISELDGI